MMANYSAEEIRAFKLKDILNSRMSALKAAATNNEGKGVSAADLMIEASQYYVWVRQDQDDVGGDTKDMSSKCPTLGQQNNQEMLGHTGQLPEPTLAQKKVIDAITAKLGLIQADPMLKGRILQWAKEVHGQDSYPTKLDSVDVFIKWYRTSN